MPACRKIRIFPRNLSQTWDINLLIRSFALKKERERERSNFNSSLKSEKIWVRPSSHKQFWHSVRLRYYDKKDITIIWQVVAHGFYFYPEYIFIVWIKIINFWIFLSQTCWTREETHHWCLWLESLEMHHQYFYKKPYMLYVYMFLPSVTRAFERARSVSNCDIFFFFAFISQIFVIFWLISVHLFVCPPQYLNLIWKMIQKSALHFQILISKVFSRSNVYDYFGIGGSRYHLKRTLYARYICKILSFGQAKHGGLVLCSIK